MNWKQILFWSLSAAAIFYYLLLFGVFLFVGQEEMQLFIPEWWFIRESLWQPGGFCDVAGQWIIQYYRQPMLAVVLHSVLLVSSGLMIDKLLCGFSGKSYLSFLSLLPVLYLLKMSVHGEYLVDGTVGIVLMLLALLLSLNIRRVRFIIGYGLFYALFMRVDRTSFGLLRIFIYAACLLSLPNTAAKMGGRCLFDPGCFHLPV